MHRKRKQEQQLKDLIAAAEEYAQAIVTKAPLAVVFAKEAVRKGFEMSLEDGLRLETDLSALLRTTEDINLPSPISHLPRFGSPKKQGPTC